jgi:hypothetical protein
MSHGFQMIVPRECVGDRHKAVHESNLFDINAKNGDVVPIEYVMEYLNSRSSEHGEEIITTTTTSAQGTSTVVN